MKREIETKFFEFVQNNSGGKFDVNDDVCGRVLIEAIDKNHAVSKIMPMIENQSASCDCCGDRWDLYDIESFDNSDDYVELIRSFNWVRTSPEIIIHFLDGSKKTIYM